MRLLFALSFISICVSAATFLLLGGAGSAVLMEFSRPDSLVLGRFARNLLPRSGETSSRMQLDDGAVIRESLAKPSRFGEIFERHYDDIYAFLARRVGPDIGGDLAAQTFTAGVRRAPPLQARAE